MAEKSQHFVVVELLCAYDSTQQVSRTCVIYSAWYNTTEWYI